MSQEIHIKVFSLAKKKESYRSLLDEYKELPLDATFKDIKKKIIDDPRYTKFSSSDKKCEKEFNNWVSSYFLNTNFTGFISFSADSRQKPSSED